MSESVRISQTDFRKGSDEYRGVDIEPGLWIDYHPEDNGDFLVPDEVAQLRDWLNEHYPAVREEIPDE